jgi:hypothetical protein
MKKLLISISIIYLFLSQSHAQSPVYYFNQTIDTAYESNTTIVAGYVKTDTAPIVADTIMIALRSGDPRPTHIDTTSNYMIIFNPGQDSVAFSLHIMKDTFPEYPEHILYTLTDPINGSSIGIDSSLLFVLIDTTPPATISYIIDSASAYEDADSFYNGTYIPFNSPFYVGISVNNPNPFYIRYYADNIDCYHNSNYPFVNACALTDFYFNGETCYAPPGVSTYYKKGNMIDRNSTYDKYFLCTITNIDANIITDTFTFFTIKHVNFFDTASLSFDTNSIIIVSDSFRSVGIPITISNPNEKPLYFRIDTIHSSTIYPGINYTFNNQEYGYGNGISHDTFWVSFFNPRLIGDTISMIFALRNDSVNGSADTLLSVTVADTGGSLFISFLGAGLAHLKSDSIGYVNVYTSTFTKYPISVNVSYLNGNAKRDTDFIFNDTTITFPPFTFDTISVPVIMLQDHLYQGNTQVNLQLSNVNPSSVQYGITQYTFTIIDDEDSGLAPLGVQQTNRDQIIKIHPNPFDNEISIETSLPLYSISIANSLGENIYNQDDQKGNLNINFADRPTGLYLVRISNGDKTYVTKILKL